MFTTKKRVQAPINFAKWAALTVSEKSVIDVLVETQEKQLEKIIGVMEKPVQPLQVLNEEQQSVIEDIDAGHNIFTTGPGGTGKSFLIRHIRHHLEAKGKRVAITSLTGMAALLIGNGARTIHSWSGLGIGNRTVRDYFDFIRVKNKRVRECWRETDALIIDEISMMDAAFFEKLDELGRLLRESDKPFGGIQLLCFGDFFQLPPIEGKFVFESPVWDATLDSVIFLETIYRQKDPVFQKILNEIRHGKISNETDTLLKSRLNIDYSNEEIQPTKIFTRRDMVDTINRESLEKLPGEELVFSMTTKGKVNTDSIRNALAKMDTSSPYVETLKLKVGAQVMLITNLDTEGGLVNGKLGIVKGFIAEHVSLEEFVDKNGKTQKVKKNNPESVSVLFKGHLYPTIISAHSWKLENNETISRNQIPLALAYAITIHKSQGSTLDSAYIDIGSSVFAYGQSYVALSRVKTLDSLYLHAYDRNAVRAHPKVVAYYNSLLF